MLKWTTTDQSELHGIKGLLYGPAGVGKTKLAATMPAPLILSAESGLLSLREYQLPVIIIKTVDDLSEAYEYALLSAECRSNFQSIYIDSLSEIAEVVLANAKRQVKDPRQAYGELIEKMLDLIRKFRDLAGYHVFMAAKMEPSKDEMTGVVKYGPMMPGSKLGNQLPYLFDEVFRMGVAKTPEGEEYRFLQTKVSLQHEAKDRSGALDEFEYPDIANIINKIYAVTPPIETTETLAEQDENGTT